MQKRPQYLILWYCGGSLEIDSIQLSLVFNSIKILAANQTNSLVLEHTLEFSRA